MPDSEQWAVVRKAPLHCSFLNCAPTEGKFRQERVPDGLRHGALVNDHPGCAELVAEHGEAEGKEGLAHGHEDLAAFLEQGIKALRFFIAVYAKGKIDAAHGLKFVRRAVAGHQERISDDDAGVDDAFLQSRREVFRLGHLVEGLHRDDLSAQMLFVEVERLGAVAAVVEVGGQFHRFDLPFGE